MIHNHNHYCNCEHESVKYCKHCHVVYCLHYNQEWHMNYYYYNSYIPYVTYTSGNLSTGYHNTFGDTPSTTACSHGA